MCVCFCDFIAGKCITVAGGQYTAFLFLNHLVHGIISVYLVCFTLIHDQDNQEQKVLVLLAPFHQLEPGASSRLVLPLIRRSIFNLQELVRFPQDIESHVIISVSTPVNISTSPLAFVVPKFYLVPPHPLT